MSWYVLVTETLDAACAQWLQEALPAGSQVVFAKAEEQAPLEELLPLADALVVRTYTEVNSALLDQAPRLKVVARAGVGLDNVDLQQCRQRNIAVVYTPDANTQAVVEYAWGHMLDLVRPRGALPAHADASVFHAMRVSEVGSQLSDMTLGIVGMGRIGKRMAQVGAALGMRVLGCDVLPESQVCPGLSDTGMEFVSHQQLYAESDFVTLHADGRADNRHMINAAVLAQFKQGAVLMNFARGMLVDTHAVAAWLDADSQARALLDVHDPEPPAEDNPLWSQSRAMLFAHLASRTDKALANMSWVVRDVLSVLEGKAPRYPAF